MTSSVNLAKGQTVNLTKADNSALKNVRMGLGWDERAAAPVKKGFFSRLAAPASGGGIDLDASVILVGGSKAHETVFFGHLRSDDGSVLHTGDNLTGAGDGDDESIKVDLSRVPAHIEHLVFVINSYSGETFDQIDNAVARLVDSDDGDRELCRFGLAGSGSSTAMVMARVSRSASGWTFTAIGTPGQGRTAQQVSSLALASI